jgi:hypothetical protein
LDLHNALLAAKRTQEQIPADYRNVFNIALYSLASGDYRTAIDLYPRTAEIASDRVRSAAVQELAAFAALFPENSTAQTVLARLTEIRSADRPPTIGFSKSAGEGASG